MGTKRKLQSVLCMLLVCMMILNVPMTALASSTETIVQASESMQEEGVEDTEQENGFAAPPEAAEQTEEEGQDEEEITEQALTEKEEEIILGEEQNVNPASKEPTMVVETEESDDIKAETVHVSDDYARETSLVETDLKLQNRPVGSETVVFPGEVKSKKRSRNCVGNYAVSSHHAVLLYRFYCRSSLQTVTCTKEKCVWISVGT